jgi:arylsulfatase A-like enzyme
MFLFQPPCLSEQIAALFAVFEGKLMGPPNASRGRGPAFAPHFGDRLLRYATFGILVGLITGLLEAAVILFRIHVLDSIIRLSHHVIWMAPLGDALLFCVVGVAIALVTHPIDRRFGTFHARAALMLVLVFLGAFAVLHWIPGVSALARGILACGVAVQVTRLARSRPGWLQRPWHATVGTLALVGLVGAVWIGGIAWKERRALASLPSAHGDAPNILYLVLDTVGAPWLSVYGYDKPTSPQMEAIAEDGVLFERAYAPSSWSLPSHGSMLTGRMPHELGVDWWLPMDDMFPTLGELLASAGYATGAFMANQAYGSPVMGLGRGFHHHDVFPVSWGEVTLSTALGTILQGSYTLRRLFGRWRHLSHRPAANINQDLLRWVDGMQRRPFFAFVNYFDAHKPYEPPAPFDSLFGPRVDPLPKGVRINLRNTGVPNALYRDSPELIGRILDAYDGTVAYVDDQVGRLLEEFDARGLLDNTIVIVTSDHGEYRGEQGRFGHGGVPYASVLHVPLILRFPRGLPSGIRVSEPVSLRDLPATVVRLSGLDAAISIPGSPLTSYLASAPGSHPVFASGFVRLENRPLARRRPRVRTVIVGQHQLIQYDDGREELFDLGVDPFSTIDLLPEMNDSPHTRRLREALDAAWIDRARYPWSVRARRASTEP